MNYENTKSIEEIRSHSPHAGYIHVRCGACIIISSAFLRFANSQPACHAIIIINIDITAALHTETTDRPAYNFSSLPFFLFSGPKLAKRKLRVYQSAHRTFHNRQCRNMYVALYNTTFNIGSKQRHVPGACCHYKTIAKYRPFIHPSTCGACVRSLALSLAVNNGKRATTPHIFNSHTHPSNADIHMPIVEMLGIRLHSEHC